MRDGSRFRVAALGDSIVAGTPAGDPDPVVRSTLAGADPRSQWMFWAERNDPSVVFSNHGTNRERTDQIAVRLDAALVEADAIVVQGGINDIVQERSTDLAADDIDAMIRRAGERVEFVFVADLLPWNNGDDDAAERIVRLNEQIGQIAAARGARLLPFYETLRDPKARRRMAGEWTVEGNHPSIEGYRRLGELAWPAGTLENDNETSSLSSADAAS